MKQIFCCLIRAGVLTATLALAAPLYAQMGGGMMGGQGGMGSGMMGGGGMMGRPQGEGLSGQQIYDGACIACHGANGKGRVPGAPDFTARNGVLSKPDDVLIKHITEGFQSPGSSTAMPAKGGDPNLTETDIRNVLAYLRQTFAR